jgi:hypothetical protein
MSGGWIALIVALWLMVISLAVLVLGLINRVGQLERSAAAQPEGRRAVRGPQPGTRLPVVSRHERLAAASGTASKRLILFLSSSCGPCTRLASDLRAAAATEERVQALPPADVELLVVTDLGGAEVFGDLVVAELVVQSDGELSSAWDVPGTPFGVSVDETGVVRASGFASTLAQLNDLAGVLADPVLVG